MCTEIEQRFGQDAVDIYGLSEVMGPGVTNECIGTKDGPVMGEEHVSPEIIAPVSGGPLPVSDFEGEIVFDIGVQCTMLVAKKDSWVICGGYTSTD